MTEQTPNIYALLIGIDGYKPAKSYPHLKGCVRDIDFVKNYLDRTLKIPPERVWMLTSPNPEMADLSAVRASAKLPTYENIVSAFRAVTETAQPGDMVYFHYAGHGCRAATIYPELKGEGQPDEGIVPMDIDAEAGRYLRDVEIATLLKQMTDKGLLVTVIFDSCHSGDVTRGDTAIRGSINLDTTIRAADRTESSVASRDELIKNWHLLNEGGRSSVTSGGFLTNPKDYVLLAACSPSESAFESNRDGKRHGALTYWMITTLATSPPQLTYRMLYEQVSAAIRSDFRERQTPMLVGDGDRTIFGSDSISYQYAISVLEVSKTDPIRVKLDAGLSTGLGCGAQFAIYPLGVTDLSQKETQIAIVEIDEEPQAAFSWAKIVKVLRPEEIKQGAQAVMLAPPTQLVRYVSLVNKAEGSGEDQLSADLLSQQASALNAVKTAIEGSGWLRLVSGTKQREDFQVAVNRKGEYEISMGRPLENVRPLQKISDPKAPQEVVKQLVHLGKYLAVQGLKNPNSELANQLELKFIPQSNSSQSDLSDLSNITWKAGEIGTLLIKNLSSEPIRVVVLDLEPTWEISQLQLRQPAQKFYEFAPQQEIPVRLRLSLPDDALYDKGLEVIKVFATVGSPDFRWLEIPPLDKDIPTAASRGLEGPEGGDFDDPLAGLFAAIGSDPDKPPAETRAQVIFDPNSEWATKDIQITVMR